MVSRPYIVLRRLTGSDLGWFADARIRGRARGNQRGINFNSDIMQLLFDKKLISSGNIRIITRRISDGQEQNRSLKRQEKNWRLVGNKVSGQGLDAIDEGDWFIARIEPKGHQPTLINWDVVIKATDPVRHAELSKDCAAFLRQGMAVWPISDPVAGHVERFVTGDNNRSNTRDNLEMHIEGPSSNKPQVVIPSHPMPAELTSPKKKRRIENKLRQPNILSEIVKSGVLLSTEAQSTFIDVLDTIASETRRLLEDAKLLCRVTIDHGRAWAHVHGKKIGFVDGGMANIAALGAAPIAIRVGSYVVTPGETGSQREQFDFEIQLVDDLFDQSPAGTYDALFDDIAKLRDAARISCEAAGVISLCCKEAPPEIVFLHGPLVNPVSPYALERFPNFTVETTKKLLPPDGVDSGGRRANFVNVYLEQLSRLTKAKSVVSGIVERASGSGAGHFSRAILSLLRERSFIDADSSHAFLERLESYQITDSVLFECILEEGEYVEPIPVDKQGPSHKIPDAWRYEIERYPRPHVTYVKPSSETMPIRVESFFSVASNAGDLMELVVHMSRLLPKYAFPVGLDIVDKHAKIPDWMSRQVNAMLSVQMMKRAMDSGNQQTIRLVRRILSANTRDWLFRPNFSGG